jgi:hypothetical protein
MLLADDQALVRGALAALLRLEPDIEVVAQVGSGEEVVAAARRHNPDVALLDVQMPGKDGLTAAAELHKALPGCRSAPRSAGLATWPGPWPRVLPGSSSRTPRLSNSSRRCGECTPDCGWSTLRWRRSRWPAVPVR